MKIRRMLKAAAEEGDIALLYKLIQKDPKVLDRMDESSFVKSPLHIAAEAGHREFAAEIMRLKPSFALKPNLQGLSPIHLALQRHDEDMVLRFVDINKELVRVKGREGLTPLHIVSQNGDTKLLVKFLKACPDSIEDVTVRSETALHIAVKCGQYEALQVLVGWIKRNCRKGAVDLERSIMKRKDDDGNTILHLSALKDDTQALDLLIESKLMDLKVRNVGNSTALHIARESGSEGNAKKLERAEAKSGCSESDTDNDSTLADLLRSKTTFFERRVIRIHRIRGSISKEQRNAYLIVAALVVTAIFQTALSPPGGVYQANAGDNSSNQNTTAGSSLNSTVTATPKNNAGTAVMSPANFFVLSFFSSSTFLATLLIIFILMPSGFVGVELIIVTSSFAISYLMSMLVISPPILATTLFIVFIIIFGVCSVMLFWICSAGAKRKLQRTTGSP